MALIGSFDAETNALEWFDPQITIAGNYEYGFPWEHDLVDVAPVSLTQVPYDVPHSPQHQTMVAM